MAITRLSGGLTPADGGDPRTFPAIWNDAATQIETAQTDIDAVELDVLGAQTDISTLQGAVATAEGEIDALQSGLATTQSDLDTLEASAVTLAAGTPVDGNSIVYDTASGGWIPGEGGGGASVTISATAPADPADGDMWWNSDTGSLYLYYTDADSSQWVPADGPQMVVSDTAPSGYQGQLWFDSSQGQMFLYYDDGDSAQWVSANGPQVMVSEVQPDGYQGQLWFDSTTGKTYIYYDDGTTAQWVSAIGGSLAGSVLQVVSTTKTDTFSASVAAGSWADITGLSATITPRDANSKILVSYTIWGSRTDNYGVVASRVTRDGTAIGVGDAAGSRIQVGGASIVVVADVGSMVNASGEYLDSPASTSALTYQVQGSPLSASGSLTLLVNRTPVDSDAVNRPRTASTLTLMEIAG